MYKVSIKGGKSLGYTDSLNYIKIHETGCFTSASKEDAIGIAFCSVPYNLDGHNDIPGAETVVVVELDAYYAFEEANEKINEFQEENEKIIDALLGENEEV